MFRSALKLLAKVDVRPEAAVVPTGPEKCVVAGCCHEQSEPSESRVAQRVVGIRSGRGDVSLASLPRAVRVPIRCQIVRLSAGGLFQQR